MMLDEKIKLTPENFCYLSRCEFFNPDINSTGCELDNMIEEEKSELEKKCPLQMERMFRFEDPDWNLSEEDMAQKLRDIDEFIKKDKKIIKEIGPEAYSKAIKDCSELAQKVQNAKIEYEQLQYELQEIQTRCLGNFEKEKK